MIRVLTATSVLAAFSGPCGGGDRPFTTFPAETALTVVTLRWDEALYETAPGVRFELSLERPANAERPSNPGSYDELALDITYAAPSTSTVSVELTDCDGQPIVDLADVIAARERGSDLTRRIRVPDPFLDCPDPAEPCQVQRCLTLTLVEGPGAWVGGSWVIGTKDVLSDQQATALPSDEP